MSLSPSVNDAGLMNVAGAVRVRDEATSTRRADPTLPAVLRIGPGLLLDLEPPPRRPGLVQTRLILGDVALVAAFDHLRPRLQAVLREPSALEFGRDRSVAPDEPQYVLAVLVDDDDGARITHRRLVPRFTVGERNAASRHVHARWVETERTVVLDDGLSPDRRTASQRVVPTVPRAGEHLEIRDRLLRLSDRDRGQREHDGDDDRRFCEHANLLSKASVVVPDEPSGSGGQSRDGAQSGRGSVRPLKSPGLAQVLRLGVAEVQHQLNGGVRPSNFSMQPTAFGRG